MQPGYGTVGLWVWAIGLKTQWLSVTRASRLSLAPHSLSFFLVPGLLGSCDWSIHRSFAQSLDGSRLPGVHMLWWLLAGQARKFYSSSRMRLEKRPERGRR